MKFGDDSLLLIRSSLEFCSILNFFIWCKVYFHDIAKLDNEIGGWESLIKFVYQIF